MKELLRRTAVSFAISSLAGLLVNLVIDAVANQAGGDGFIAMSPAFVAMFKTPVLAAYVNVLLYGAIGAVFAAMTMIFEARRIGVILQWILYFCVTSIVCMIITILLWQLHRYPVALVCTFLGYGVTYFIMGVIQYRKLKADIKTINETVILEKETTQAVL